MKNIFAVNLIPKLRILPQPCRRLNGYIHVIEGEMDFCFKNNRIHIYPGCIIYLPHGSNHIYRAVSEKIRYIRPDFEMYSAEKNEMIVFSSTPQLITNNADRKVVNILSEMSAIFYTGGYASVLKIKALLYMSIIDIALDVGYTDQNYYSRVFKKFVNKSPSEYRKEYRI